MKFLREGDIDLALSDLAICIGGLMAHSVIDKKIAKVAGSMGSCSRWHGWINLTKGQLGNTGVEHGFQLQT
jgi:hypothetical protein